MSRDPDKCRPAMALDWGERRIGVAVSDPGRTVALPRAAWDRTGLRSVAEELARAVAQDRVGTLVMGLPLGLDGREGAACAKVRRFAAELQRMFPDLEIRFMDERLTSVQADAHRIDADAGPLRDKGLRDSAAAAILLQAFLDLNRNAPD